MTHVTVHKPVLLNEAIQFLVSDPDGIYIDGTLGGGGHSAQILNRLSKKGRLFGLDQDDEALCRTAALFADEPRITIIRGNFGYMDALLPKETDGRLAGILLDLGVSSNQIDDARRGFSFQKDGPLDMRMGGLQDITAAKIVNEYEYEELRDLFYEYGEERESARIAKAILRERPLKTTGQLRDVIASVMPERFLNKSLARIFQALRIAVNSELNMLKRVLETGTGMLRENGRFVVITYHSLEDRLCKNYFRYGNFEGKPVKDFYGNDVRPLNVLTKKVITPSDNEVAANPRARSAKLRAAVKLPEGPAGRNRDVAAHTGKNGGLT